MERVEFAVIIAERAVDTYLPPPLPLTDVAEPQTVSPQAPRPLVVRALQLPVTVTRRVTQKAVGAIDFSKVKLRTQEAVDSFVHIDLLAYAAGQTAAIKAYAKVQAANMSNAVAVARERAVNSCTHARGHLEAIVERLPRPAELQRRLLDPARREQLRQALKQVVETLRVKAEEARVYGVVYGKQVARFVLSNAKAVLEVSMKKLPDEAKQALFNTIRQAETLVRYFLGDKATEQAVAYATQMLVTAWVFADVQEGEGAVPAGNQQQQAAAAAAQGAETQTPPAQEGGETPAVSTPRQTKKKGGKKQQ